MLNFPFLHLHSAMTHDISVGHPHVPMFFFLQMSIGQFYKYREEHIFGGTTHTFSLLFVRM